MAWYYYSGNIVRSIPVKAGLSKVAKPRSKIEIITETKEVQIMKKRGLLRRTSPVKGAVSVVSDPVEELKMEDVIQKSAMAKVVAEKGVTGSKGLPPTTKGNPEMTEAELASVESTEKEADVLPKDETVDDKKKEKQKRQGPFKETVRKLD